MTGGAITILGLGSLLSERSARTTFPALKNFRLVRLKNYRRVFAHTPSIFVQRGIADMEKLEMASLSAEPCEGSSFVMTAFEVDDDGTGMDAFREREEEFDLTMVPYCTSPEEGSPEASTLGMLCQCGTDEGYVSEDRIQTHTITGNEGRSLLRVAPCLLAFSHRSSSGARSASTTNTRPEASPPSGTGLMTAAFCHAAPTSATACSPLRG